MPPGEEGQVLEIPLGELQPVLDWTYNGRFTNCQQYVDRLLRGLGLPQELLEQLVLPGLLSQDPEQLMGYSGMSFKLVEKQARMLASDDSNDLRLSFASDCGREEKDNDGDRDGEEAEEEELMVHESAGDPRAPAGREGLQPKYLNMYKSPLPGELGFGKARFLKGRPLCRASARIRKLHVLFSSIWAVDKAATNPYTRGRDKRYRRGLVAGLCKSGEWDPIGLVGGAADGGGGNALSSSVDSAGSGITNSSMTPARTAAANTARHNVFRTPASSYSASSAANSSTFLF